MYKVFISESPLHCNYTVTHSFSSAYIEQINFAEGRPEKTMATFAIFKCSFFQRIQSVLLKLFKLTANVGMLVIVAFKEKNWCICFEC